MGLCNLVQSSNSLEEICNVETQEFNLGVMQEYYTKFVVEN